LNYSVGQIIYLLSKKDVKVYPVQVIEEVTRKTIEKEMISYVIKLPDNKETEILLEQVDAEIFTTLDDVESKMMDNASKQIKSFLKNAKSMSKIFKDILVENDDQKDENELPEKPEHKKETKKGNTAEVDLGNGIKGKINLGNLPV
jgi:phage-related tail protein